MLLTHIRPKNALRSERGFFCCSKKHQAKVVFLLGIASNLVHNIVYSIVCVSEVSGIYWDEEVCKA